MMNFWRRLHEHLRNEPRALAGLLLLVLLVGVAVVLDLDDLRLKRKSELDTLLPQLARWNAVATETHWLKQRDESRWRLAEFRTRCWREESEGRIQAGFQDWLRERALTQQLKLVEISVSEPMTDSALPSEMRLARARLTVEFVSDRLSAFLAELAAEKHWLWVERLRVLNYPRERRAEIELAALYAIGTKGEQ